MRGPAGRALRGVHTVFQPAHDLGARSFTISLELTVSLGALAMQVSKSKDAAAAFAKQSAAVGFQGVPPWRVLW